MSEKPNLSLKNFSFPETFVLFDLEYTAWEESYARNWSGENEYREVIQVGAIRVAGSNLEEQANIFEYVKPVINPKLSEFIINFTGIAQQDVDTHGIAFTEALKKLEDFVGDRSAYCWGRDIDVLEENCKLNKLDVPAFFSQMTNLKPILSPIFESAGVDTKKYSSGTLVTAFTGTQESRRAHDALNDMRNFKDALLKLEARIA